jgi:hypothetical protein
MEGHADRAMRISVGVPEGVLDGLDYLGKGVYDLVLGVEPRLHLLAQTAQTVLEIIEGFVMKLLIEHRIPSLNFRCEAI